MSIRHMSAIWDSQLYDGPKLLMMLALADWADADGWCYPKNETLARRIRRDVKSVYRILGQLETEGAIHRADGRICICEPWIVEEVKRRAEAAEAKNAPPQPPAALKTEKPILKSENSRAAAANTVLKIENEILTNENPILNSENGILKNETPFFIDPSFTPDLDPLSTPAAPAPATKPSAVAAAPPLALDPILRWIEFSDRLNDKERATLDPPTLLAWAYWIHLEEAKPTRPKNAVAIARSQWRKGLRPPDDLLALAHSWLSRDVDDRRALLEALQFAARYGADDPSLDDNFPGVPIAAAIRLYRATAGELAPPSLMPPPADNNRPRPQPPAPSTPPAQPPAAANAPLWRDALPELEMQMTKATFATWLQGTTATLTGDTLTVHVRNHHAVDWLSNRLHDLITRTVNAIAGRPLTIHYEVCP